MDIDGASRQRNYDNTPAMGDSLEPVTGTSSRTDCEDLHDEHFRRQFHRRHGCRSGHRWGCAARRRWRDFLRNAARSPGWQLSKALVMIDTLHPCMNRGADYWDEDPAVDFGRRSMSHRVTARARSWVGALPASAEATERLRCAAGLKQVKIHGFPRWRSCATRAEGLSGDRLSNAPGRQSRGCRLLRRALVDGAARRLHEGRDRDRRRSLRSSARHPIGQPGPVGQDPGGSRSRKRDAGRRSCAAASGAARWRNQRRAVVLGHYRLHTAFADRPHGSSHPPLDDYAEVVIAPRSRGGDVLKRLAMVCWPSSPAPRRRMRARRRCGPNATCAAAGRPRRPLLDLWPAGADIHLGLHVGDVFYGNIGSRIGSISPWSGRR